MASIRFYPYSKKGKCKVYSRITVKRGRDFRLSTTLTIEDASTWNKETHFPKKNSETNKNLHKSLRGLEDYIYDELLKVEKSTTMSTDEITSKWVKETILTHFNENPIDEGDLLIPFANKYAEDLKYKTYKKNGNRIPYKENTINKYRNFAKQLEDYQTKSKKPFKIIDVDENFSDKFLDYLTEKGLAINTKGRYIKRLKTIIINADENGIKTNPNYKLIQGFEDEIIVTYLNFEEIDDIIETNVNNKRLEIAKDWLVIACYTAQRISDLYRMKKSMIITENGASYITFKQFKTSKRVKVPIHYKVKKILKKYGNGFPPNISKNEKSNRSILSSLMKKVCEKAGITEIVDGRLNGVKGMYPKYKLIHNHSCRRSFCCNFYGMEGWTTPMIMEITGHETEKSFYRYIDKESFYLSERASQNFAAMEERDKNKRKELRVLKKA